MFDKSTDDGNDVMVVQFRRETSTEMDVKTVNIVVKKTNRQQFSKVSTLIVHTNDVMFKTLQ